MSPNKFNKKGKKEKLAGIQRFVKWKGSYDSLCPNTDRDLTICSGLGISAQRSFITPHQPPHPSFLSFAGSEFTVCTGKKGWFWSILPKQGWSQPWALVSCIWSLLLWPYKPLSSCFKWPFFPGAKNTCSKARRWDWKLFLTLASYLPLCVSFSSEATFGKVMPNT